MAYNCDDLPLSVFDTLHSDRQSDPIVIDSSNQFGRTSRLKQP